MRSATRRGGRQIRGELLGSAFMSAALSASYYSARGIEDHDRIREEPRKTQSEVGKLYFGPGVGNYFGEDHGRRWQAWLVADRGACCAS